MKTYKVELINFGTEEEPQYSDAIDLVNVDDDTDRIWASDDDFAVGEIITEDKIYTETCSYVDDTGTGSALFAFKKQ